MKKGLIFDVQKFSLHDGPGIRTTIFFKGCPLRCKWCHNPESISNLPQLNYDKKKCVLCGTCVKFVKNDGIKINKNNLEVDFRKHDQNFKLVEICPHRAFGIYGKFMEIEELVKDILKDKEYYDNSNGGVTFSGGEALYQIEFISKLGYKLKEKNVKICLDISGFDPNNIIEKTFDFIDLYLLDYKLSVREKEKQKKYLGQKIDIEKTLDLLEKNKKKVILRCPIIPSVNDNLEHFKEISILGEKYSCIKQIDLLPYHNMKKNKFFLPLIKVEEFKIPKSGDKENWERILINLNCKKVKKGEKNVSVEI